MRRIFHAISLAALILISVGCRQSGSYIVLVTATPAGGAVGGGSDLISPEILQPSELPESGPMFVPTPDATRPSAVDAAQDQTYVVVPGDTLSQISLRFGVTVESIIQANRLPDATTLTVGQTLLIPTAIQVTGPAFKIIPDSELVYGPHSGAFDVAAFLVGKDCFLCRYREEIDGQQWSGANIIQLVAREQSLNPRLLLALLEYESHWVSQSTIDEDAATYPLGFYEQPGQVYGLYRQLDWAGKLLQTGYYGWKLRGLSATLLADGSRAGLDPTLNAGTAGVQVLLSRTRDLEGWIQAAQPSGFYTTYASMFGDPFQYATEPIIPADLSQPPMSFPWAKDEIWYFTGGPHGGWGAGGAWAAIDFVSGEKVSGCDEASEWARAVADGVIAVSDYGLLILDLDRDGNPGTGWAVVYLHLSSADRAVVAGQSVALGDALGHPSCEGGFSTATHLHIARRYNGEWVAADCSRCLFVSPVPQLNFDGWIASSFGREYDGSLTKGEAYREACTCRDEINALTISGQ